MAVLHSTAMCNQILIDPSLQILCSLIKSREVWGRPKKCGAREKLIKYYISWCCGIILILQCNGLQWTLDNGQHKMQLKLKALQLCATEYYCADAMGKGLYWPAMQSHAICAASDIISSSHNMYPVAFLRCKRLLSKLLQKYLFTWKQNTLGLAKYATVLLRNLFKNWQRSKYIKRASLAMEIPNIKRIAK